VNDLFEGDLTDDDKLVCQPGHPRQADGIGAAGEQARNNTEAQFAASPTLMPS
jgi:hypothetical protein